MLYIHIKELHFSWILELLGKGEGNQANGSNMELHARTTTTMCTHNVPRKGRYHEVIRVEIYRERSMRKYLSRSIAEYDGYHDGSLDRSDTTRYYEKTSITTQYHEAMFELGRFGYHEILREDLTYRKVTRGRLDTTWHHEGFMYGGLP
jgi:hypothetical protein